MPSTIDRDELKPLVDAGRVILVDALGAEAYEKSHLPGAINIYYEDVEERSPELLPDKDAPIVTYCANLACRNSELAARKLEALGYTDVREYAAGRADWEEGGLPLEGAVAV